MRVERLSNDQFKIFITFDDLMERGLHSNNMQIDTESVKNLFSDMMDEACDELDIDLQGSFHLQVQIMQSQGMNVFVTQKDDEIEYDDYIDMNVTLTESDELIFCSKDFENIINASNYLNRLDIREGEVYYKDQCYYFILDSYDLSPNKTENVIAIMSEFSMPSIITSHNLKEYGKPIITSNGVETIIHYFS